MSSAACVLENPEFDGDASIDTMNVELDDTTISIDATPGPAQFDEQVEVGCTVFECVSFNVNSPHRPKFGPIRDYRYAAKIPAERDYLVVGAEVVTGNASGVNRLSVWRSSNNFPSSELSGGSWKMDEILGWQGAFFEEPASIEENENFWVVWDPVSGSEGTIANHGVGVDATYQSPGGPWYRSGYIPYMIRVYCCRSDSNSD